MFELKTKLLTATLGMALLASCGGGGGGGGGTAPATEAPATEAPAIETPPSTITVTGTSSGGIILNGLVRAFRFDGGVRGELLAEQPTSELGVYSIDVTDYTGPVEIIVITNPDPVAGEETQMLCDVTPSCSTGVNFGDLYTLGNDFQLKAILSVTEAKDVSKVSITPITSLAAAATEGQLQSGQDIETAIRQADLSVAEFLGIDLGQGTITDIQPVDITKATNVGEANANDLKAQLIGVGILSLGVNSDAGTLESGLTAIIEQVSANAQTEANAILADNGGEGVAAISLTEILSESQKALPALAAFDTANELVTDLGNALTQQVSKAEAAPTGINPIVVTEPAAPGEELAAAKAIVSLVQSVGLAATFDSQTAAGETLIEEVDTIAAAFSDDAEEVLNAFLTGVEALAEASEALELSSAPTTFEFSAAPETTITVAISVNEDGTTQFTITDQTIDLVTLNLTASNKFSNEESNSQSESAVDTFTTITTVTNIFSERSDEVVTLSGTATSSKAELTINPGSLVLVENVTETDTDIQTIFGQTGFSNLNLDDELSVDKARLRLDVSLTQQNETSPASFSGIIDLTINALVTGENEVFGLNNGFFEVALDPETCRPADSQTGLNDECIFTQSFSDRTRFGSIEAILSGGFSQGGNSFEARFSFTADGSKFEESFLFEQTGTIGGSAQGLISFTDIDSDNNSPENFITGSIGISLTTELPGIDETTRVLLSVARTDFNAGNALLELEFNGIKLETDATLLQAANPEDDGAVTITISDGKAIINLSENNTGDIEGNITVNGEVFATIAEENGITIVRFPDDSFVSII